MTRPIPDFKRDDILYYMCIFYILQYVIQMSFCLEYLLLFDILIPAHHLKICAYTFLQWCLT